MATVKNCIDQKSAAVISLTPADSVFDALELMDLYIPLHDTSKTNTAPEQGAQSHVI